MASPKAVATAIAAALTIVAAITLAFLPSAAVEPARPAVTAKPLPAIPTVATVNEFRSLWKERYTFRGHRMKELSAELLRAAEELIARSPGELGSLARAASLDRPIEPGLKAFEALAAFEESLGRPPKVLDALDAESQLAMAMERYSEWSEIRSKAFVEFSPRESTDPAAALIVETLLGWQREKLRIVALETQKGHGFSGMLWEQAFFDFCATRPTTALVWGWLVARSRGDDVRATVGAIDAASGYRHYVLSNRFDTDLRARRLVEAPALDRTRKILGPVTLL